MIATGCGGGGEPADPLAEFTTQKLQWQACDPSIAGADWSSLLEPLSSRARCAMMRAPLDYDDPGRGELVVALLRVAAEVPAQRRGAIVFNPGGPGEDGLRLAPYVSALWSNGRVDDPTGALFRQLSREFDLVGFSPRGTGASTRLYCGSNEALRFVGSYLDRSKANIEAMLWNARLKAEACAKNPLSRYIHTEATARDLDLMRQLLGDDKLNYYGMSYGTWLGHWYASLFPERVGRMVFSGVVDFTHGMDELGLTHPLGNQRTFDAVIVPYAQRHAAVFSSDGSAANLGQIFASLHSRPFLQAAVTEIEFESLVSPRLATDAVLALVVAKKLGDLLDSIVAPDEAAKEDALRAAIPNTAFAAEVTDPDETDPARTLNRRARALAQRIAGEYFDKLANKTPPVELSGTTAMIPVVCSNDFPMRKSIDEWVAANNRDAIAYPLVGGKMTDWLGLYWGGPVVTRPPLERATRAGGIVFLQTEYDVRTLREGAEAALATMPNASYVYIANESEHAPLLPYQRLCVDEPIARYLLTGAHPQPRTQCAGKPLPWDAVSATSAGSAASFNESMFEDPAAARRIYQRLAKIIGRDNRTTDTP